MDMVQCWRSVTPPPSKEELRVWWKLRHVPHQQHRNRGRDRGHAGCCVAVYSPNPDSLLLRTVSASSIVREDSTELIESRRTSTILLAAFRDLWVCLVLTMYYRGRVREGGRRGRELRKNNSTIWSNPKENGLTWPLVKRTDPLYAFSISISISPKPATERRLLCY